MTHPPNPDLERYPHWVRWSPEDGVYIGRCPSLFLGGVHGDDPAAVLTHLREVMDEWVSEAVEGGEPLPPPADWPPDRLALRRGHAVTPHSNSGGLPDAKSESAEGVSRVSTSAAA